MSAVLDYIKTVKDHPDYVEGYKDGYDLDAPEPNNNRSEEYKHSYRIGRGEKTGNYIPLDEIILSLKKIEDNK